MLGLPGGGVWPLSPVQRSSEGCMLRHREPLRWRPGRYLGSSAAQKSHLASGFLLEVELSVLFI